MLTAFFSFFSGVLLWTLTEYLLHRFIFHGASVRRPGAKEHRRHHTQGNYFAPWWQKALAALAVVGIMLPLSCLLAGVVPGASFTSGFVAMYLLYEILHRRAHTHPPRNRYGRWRRKHHFSHHFADPRLAQGVSTPLWDHVFGTLLPLDRVPVPRRLAMTWLLNENGEILPAYSDDYELVGARRDPIRSTL